MYQSNFFEQTNELFRSDNNAFYVDGSNLNGLALPFHWTNHLSDN